MRLAQIITIALNDTEAAWPNFGHCSFPSARPLTATARLMSVVNEQTGRRMSEKVIHFSLYQTHDPFIKTNRPDRPPASCPLVQVDNKGRNFLHVAVQSSDIESVLFLISVQANVNSRVQDSAKQTPLHLAVQAGSEIIVRNLVIQLLHWINRDAQYVQQ